MLLRSQTPPLGTSVIPSLFSISKQSPRFPKIPALKCTPVAKKLSLRCESKGPPPTFDEVFEMTKSSIVNLYSVAPNEAYVRFVKGFTAGTAIVWDDQVHLVTNAHVIHDAIDLYALCSNGDILYSTSYFRMDMVKEEIRPYLFKLDRTLEETTFFGQIFCVGTDLDLDIAVLKIEPTEKLIPMKFRSSSEKFKRGDITYAMGNAFGSPHTLTEGVINNFDRSLISGASGKFMGAISFQTTTPFLAGMSGGPFMDEYGYCIGQIVQGRDTAHNFATKIDLVQESVDKIIRSSKVVPKWQELEHPPLVDVLLEHSPPSIIFTPPGASSSIDWVLKDIQRK